MREMPSVQLVRPIARIRVFHAAGEPCADGPETPNDEEQATAARLEGIIQAERARMAEELEKHKSQVSELCQTVGNVAKTLERLHQETLLNNRTEIAKLAVEIARKILLHKVAQGDYDIQAIVEEALKIAPTRQNIVIRLNPEDLSQCQRQQQENPDSPFAELEFTADWSVGRAECLVETPKGIVRSFIEEHLERIGEALQKVE